MAIFKLSRAERKRISAFFTCLVLAVIAWIFVTMSNNYIFPVKVTLTYKNQPFRKAFYALQADTIMAMVGGTGWQKLFANISASPNRSIAVDLKKLETQNFIVLSSQLPFINEKSEKNQQIVSFSPDTVYFDFAARKVKQISVIVQSKIGFEQQYARSGDISINPKFVTISGPAAYVDSVNSWKTDSLITDKANSSISAKLQLLPPKENNVSVYPKTINVVIPVDEYTEKTLEIPIKLINNKIYSKVTLFPKKVKITFTVSLNNYPEVNADFFEAVADLDDWQKKGLVTLPVKLRQKPDYCNMVRIEPANINFIVQK